MNSLRELTKEQKTKEGLLQETGVKELSELFWNNDPRLTHVDSVNVLYNHRVQGAKYTEQICFIMAFGNVTVFNTKEGLVLVDCGAQMFGYPILSEIREHSQKRIHTVIYTHGHMDHCMGIFAMEAEAKQRGDPPIRVVAHQNITRRFERYKKTIGYNSYINGRQFGAHDYKWPDTYRYPDVTYNDKLTLQVGELTFKLFHYRGETDDATAVWVPKLKALCPGDFFIWSCPNCGNPQKAERYPHEHAQALRHMESLRAEFLFPGHGPPIVSSARITQALSDTASCLESLVAQCLELINAGKTLNEVLHTVTLPPSLSHRPYLHAVYDDPSFLVHSIWRNFAGWWDQNPAHLKPPRDVDLAQALCPTDRDIVAMAESALRFHHKGQFRVAIALVQHATYALTRDTPGSIARQVHKIREQIFQHSGKQQHALMASSIYGDASRDSTSLLMSKL